MGSIYLILVCSLARIMGSYCISVSEDEPVLTSYHPCDLAFINFETTNRSNWKAFLNFGLYPNLKEALLKIYFSKEVTITPILNTHSTSLRYDNQSLVVQSKHPIPKLYTFNVSTGSQNSDEKNVPIVHNLTLNNEILCNSIKRNRSIAPLNVTELYNGRHYSHSCGKRSIYHAEHISLRTEANAGDWPWHVAIFYKKGTEVVYQCGGSIVSTTAVLTAAHCIIPDIPTKDYIVVAGISNVNNIDKDFDVQNLTVQQIIIHPKYKYNVSTADLAIIKVKRIQFTVHVQPVCIWGPSGHKSDLFGLEATIVGFGENEHGKLNNNLRAINIMVQKDTTCKRFRRLLNKSTFCAGNGPDTITNVRNGDSGGGLLVRTSQPDHGNTWFIRGVLSKCGTSANTLSQAQPLVCDPKQYVIFTNIAVHYHWIIQNAGLVNVSPVTA